VFECAIGLNCVLAFAYLLFVTYFFRKILEQRLIEIFEFSFCRYRSFQLVYETRF